MDLVAEAVTGSIGGFVGRSVAYPFDTLKVKLATKAANTGAAQLIRRLLHEEGIGALYRGLPFSALEALYQKFIYVFFYSFLKNSYSRLAGGGPVSAMGSVTCGYLSEMVSVPLCVPFEAMVVQLQSAPPGASQLAIVRSALLTRSGLLAGLRSGQAYILLALKPGFEFALFDALKRAVLARKCRDGEPGSASSPPDSLAPAMAFWLGAAARAVATVLTFPISRAKALTQAGLATNTVSAFRRVLAQEGAMGLYSGLAPELFRGMTQAAVMFMVMEHLRATVRRRLLTEKA